MGKKERKKAKARKKCGETNVPSCLEGFVRLCRDGWLQGWHERNGGNLSYRLAPQDREEFERYAGLAGHKGELAEWHGLSVPEPSLAGQWLLVTGSGRHMRCVAGNPEENLCLIEIDGEGASWRLLWGLSKGGAPTSELPTHLAAHTVRSMAGEGCDRAVYHAHLPNLVALTYVAEPDDRVMSRILWKTIPECVMTCPEGVGVVGWGIPGSRELAEATRAKMERYRAVVWALHGVFCTGPTFDETFGYAQTLEKAAQIYRFACSMNGGSNVFRQTIPDEGLLACAAACGREANPEFLNV